MQKTDDLLLAALRDHGLGVFPTETVYGLGCDPFDPVSVRRLFEVKGRAPDKPLPLVAASVRDALRLADEGARRSWWWPEALRLAEHFWPGPLTLVLPGGEGLAPGVRSAAGEMAVRVSSDPVARRLAAGVGGLLVATSANLAGEEETADPDRLSTALLDKVDAVLLEPRPRGLLPSTLLRPLQTSGWSLLRLGPIGPRELAAHGIRVDPGSSF